MSIVPRPLDRTAITVAPPAAARGVSWVRPPFGAGARVMVAVALVAALGFW